MKLLIMKFSTLPCYLVPLRPKYSSQHPVLKHPQPTFLPQFQRPSFTPIQNNRQNYSLTEITTFNDHNHILNFISFDSVIHNFFRRKCIFVFRISILPLLGHCFLEMSHHSHPPPPSYKRRETSHSVGPIPIDTTQTQHVLSHVTLRNLYHAAL